MPGNINELEQQIINATSDDMRQPLPEPAATFSPELIQLQHERNQCEDAQQRRDLSKRIQKMTRAQLRQWQSENTKTRLEQFENISELHNIHKTPVAKSRPLDKPPTCY